MRVFLQFAMYVAVALSVSGCDPITERRYITEGAGIDLYTADRAGQVELLKDYVRFVCDQVGPSCGNDWTLFVQAGMNDIDLRCDGFLTWIDARRRDKEPALAELSAIATAVHDVMTVTGSSPTSLNIVTSAFGLATATYTNWNSRLLIAINQSTIQEIVYTNQKKFRENIKDYRVPDQPAAIYLLRNYLRLCMPTTIEASINTTSTLVERGSTAAAQTNNLVVRNVAPPRRSPSSVPDATIIGSVFGPNESTAILERFLDPDGTGLRKPERVQAVTPFLIKIGLKARDLTQFLHDSQYATQRDDLVKELRGQGKL